MGHTSSPDDDSTIFSLQGRRHIGKCAGTSALWHGVNVVADKCQHVQDNIQNELLPVSRQAVDMCKPADPGPAGTAAAALTLASQQATDLAPSTYLHDSSHTCTQPVCSSQNTLPICVQRRGCRRRRFKRCLLPLLPPDAAAPWAAPAAASSAGGGAGPEAARLMVSCAAARAASSTC
jgi:hypothetical protein